MPDQHEAEPERSRTEADRVTEPIDLPAQPSAPAPAISVRGRHLAWARLERALAEPETVVRPVEAPMGAEPPPAAPAHAFAPAMDQPAATEPHEPIHVSVPQVPVTVPRDADVPGAMGRLVALVITCGLGWALVTALGIWLVALLLARLAG